jgi:two-component system NtrC family sensor kinase
MRKGINISLLLILSSVVWGQQPLPDSIRLRIQQAHNDSLKYFAYLKAYDFYEEKNRDSALLYVEHCLSLSQKNKKLLVTAACFDRKGYQLTGMGRYTEALPAFYKAFEITGNTENESSSWMLNPFPTGKATRLYVLSLTHHMYAILMLRIDNTQLGIAHFHEAKRLAVEIGHTQRIMLADMNLGRIYLSLNMIDSALYFENAALQSTNWDDVKKYYGNVLTILGDIYEYTGNYDKANSYFHEAINTSSIEKNVVALARTYHRLARYHLNQRHKDSALYYSLKVQEAQQTIGPAPTMDINSGVTYDNLYRSFLLAGKFDSSLKYAGLAMRIKDSLYEINVRSLTGVQKLSFDEQQRLLAAEKDRELYRNRVRLYALLGGLGIFLLLALILYRNNRQQNRTNKKLEDTLHDLKSTQAQLIQSEKMASLGVLTAGIAHEIQNPLNFINNFSEINTEMIGEMKTELDKGNITEAKTIATDISENEKKIHHHGKRADAIVKGMLMHSRATTGKKEPTDINALTDEYLRLSYHGLRAKDKTFNASIKTDYDPKVGSLNVIPSDIGRVVLNLVSNAFYAVTEKSKSQQNGYEPTVKVTTRQADDAVKIHVKDNGNGISKNVIEKIFQPFFTTKPTGQGTGLGLSLSYDIVKAHGGVLDVISKEGEGSEFIIALPVN